ncbi:hypothetical protein LTR91_007597 [Friedmanniomyces endolithicus]|uniref:2EXR domain-containing protein n=1 Tax=Friedmanniomyces endolithicus TaxID=329885 RepID=A0AAN6KPD8_9PEZI|nr:hypothetical protein LTR94_003145 [Friedmanniomyces endolithicus]KAK0813796.1 hypothetical protein LTR59_000951 [Friedmanniomyces endolithicus]KAK0814770.1 hypothetical protein LTR38_002600 [Friedmanniomyces endolithicus]KAK0851982.1 hypothetical protein LTR03_003727 [Friedmanniomyces endolithicus]KAK0869782.1 hypothetical protein LTS02_002828 [Friedmanniomyces endolithicus]
MPLGLAGRGKGYDHASFRSLPFNEQLARISLQVINPGPDGLASMSQCQCNMKIHEISGFYNNAPTANPPPNPAPPTKPSRLLLLPAKLRSQIFALAVTYPHPIPIRLHTTTTPPVASETTTDNNGKTRTTSLIARRRWFFSPPLLRTCRVARREATAFFYAKNEFRAELTGGDVSALVAWLRGTKGEFLRLVPKLVVSMEVRSFFDLEALRRAEGSAGQGEEWGVLSRLLVAGGVAGERIVMVDLTAWGKLVGDAGLLRRGAGDAKGVVRAWFEGFREELDREEYGFGEVGVDEEGGEVGGGGSLGESEEVGLVTGMMKKMGWPRGSKRESKRGF